MDRTFTTIDLFCGAGGVTEGLRQAGFLVLAGNDFDEVAGQTFATWGMSGKNVCLMWTTDRTTQQVDVCAFSSYAHAFSRYVPKEVLYA